MAEKMAIMLRRGLVNSSMAGMIPGAFSSKLGASALVAMLLLAEVRIVLLSGVYLNRNDNNNLGVKKGYTYILLTLFSLI